MSSSACCSFTRPATTATYPLSLHDALPISGRRLTDVLVFRVEDLDVKDLVLADGRGVFFTTPHWNGYPAVLRSEEHTSELQSHHDLVCRLLLEKKNNQAQETEEVRLTAAQT